MHDVRPRVFLSIRPLPEPLFPAFVTRCYGCTIVAVDHAASALEVTSYCVANLTVDEQNAYREAWGLGPVGEPMPPRFTDPEVTPDIDRVPASLLTTLGWRQRGRDTDEGVA